MGSPAIYWYPDAAGYLHTIDFGEGLSDLQETPTAIAEDAYGGDGTPYRHHQMAGLRVRIVLERFGTPGAVSLEREFSSLQAHLDRGGLIGFSADHARTWAGMTVTPPNQGAQLVTTGGNGFSAWSSSGSPVAGDEMVIEQGSPDWLREVVTCDTLAASPPTMIPTVDKIRYSYGGPVICRFRDFYPLLFRPKDQLGRAIVSHDHRRNYTLDLTLEYLLGATLDLWTGGDPELEGGNPFAMMRGASTPPAGPPLRGATSTYGSGGSSLQELLRQRANPTGLGRR